jgi:type IV pilus assembly protein PilA
MHTHLFASPTYRARRRSRQHGFTLIELMIVVVVVGILGVLAVLAYRKYTATARTAEAKQVTAGIRAAQEAFKTEKGIYAAVSNSDTSFYPAASPGQFVTAWGGACINCVNGADGWHQLAVEPGAPVMFGYATIAGLGGNASGAGGASAPSGGGGGPAPFSNLKATDPFYVTVAKGDTDGDGVACTVTSYSTSNQLLVQSEGE